METYYSRSSVIASRDHDTTLSFVEDGQGLVEEVGATSIIGA